MIRQIDEERPLLHLCLLHDLDDPLGVLLRQPEQVHGLLSDLEVIEQGAADLVLATAVVAGLFQGEAGLAGAHVVGVGHAEVGVEAVAGREVDAAAADAEVPLAHGRGQVAEVVVSASGCGFLEEGGDGAVAGGV